MQSNSATVQEYLDSLLKDRREAISAVRKVILKHLPKGYEAALQYGMIGYALPLKLYPQGYLGKKDVPLPYAALASQKNHMAAYLMSIYGNTKFYEWFVKAYQATGKKLDMGKSCICFKKIEDLPLEVIGQAIAATSVNEFVQKYEESRKR